MSNWRLVRLNFGRSPVHFGEVGIGIEESSERVRSDTLFSALVNAYARLFYDLNIDSLQEQEVAKLLKTFPSNKQKQTEPVRISSTFIYTYTKHSKQDNYRYYLARPAKFPLNYPDEDLSFFKSYKKLKYLPIDIWQRWYQGEGFLAADREELIEQNKTKDTDKALKRAGVFDYSKTYAVGTQPKVSIDRHTATTNFYHTGFTQFHWGKNSDGIEKRSGLYFLIYFPEHDQKLENKLKAALNLLGEEGLGGERSSGAGRFEVEYWGELPTETWQEVVNFKAQHYCLLSLFWRDSLTEDFLDDSSYELIERGGWIGSPFSGRQLRRKKVHMFAEGSVFTSKPLGQLADVTPDGFNKHPIYRSGISLSIPINVKLENRE